MSERPHRPGLTRIHAWRDERRNRRALEMARLPLAGSARRSARDASGTPAAPVTPRATPVRTARQKLVLSGLVTAIALVGLLFVGPFPVRTWWAQRSETHALQHQIDVVQQANDRLAARAKDLKDPATVARLARRDYGMVKAGERSYAILPSPKAPVTLPPVWPFVTLVPAPSPAPANGPATPGA